MLSINVFENFSNDVEIVKIFSIDDLLSNVIELFSFFLCIENWFAIFQNVHVDVSFAKKIDNFRKNFTNNIHENNVSIDNNDFEIFEIEMFVQRFQHFHYSFNFFFQKRENDIKIDV